MLADVSSEKSSLLFYIWVEDEEGGTPLSSYIKEELEKGLDAKIAIEGKNNFKFMVTNISSIQWNFWKSGCETISTVPVLLKKLNEGNSDKEWVAGWNDLEGDYKKYIAAAVLYKLSSASFPKKYEDIETYLMDK